MSIGQMLFAVILTAVAVSYGWGMRGAVIGGEKGAMLPGALLGLFIAKLSGIPVIEDNAFLFSAAGCLAMGYGGFEPYAQTMEMVIVPKSDIFNPKRGYTGLMLKGANWFGICGALFGISFTAASGFYGIYEIIAISISIPFIQALGIKLFNKPYNKSENIFPKIYFSRNSREEWGGNLLTLAMLLCVTAIKSDWFSFFFGIIGIISGAIGWAMAIWLYYITVLPLKNGKYIFGNLQKKGYIDNWKIMEFTLGFLGGGGLACYFFARLDFVESLAEAINQNGIFNPLGEHQEAAAWIAFAAAIAMVSQYFIKKLQNSRIFELTERAIYFAIILCVILLGSAQMAKLTVFMLILWAVVEKTVFDRLENTLPEKIIKIISILIFVVALASELTLENSYSDLTTILMYTFLYILADFASVATRTHPDGKIKFRERLRGCFLTFTWFIILSAILTIAVYKIF